MGRPIELRGIELDDITFRCKMKNFMLIVYLEGIVINEVDKNW